MQGAEMKKFIVLTLLSVTLAVVATLIGRAWERRQEAGRQRDGAL